MFTYAPDWYREKVQDQVLLVSDLTRLVIGKELLDEGYERVIWMDADLLVFDPAQFEIEVKEQYAFCYETWVDVNEQQTLQANWRVNNSVSVFCKGNSMLDFYIQACQDIVQKKTNFGPWYIGTVFLTMLRRIYPFELLKNVATISPFLMHAILQDKKPARELFAKVQGHPVYAGNLCGSYDAYGYKGLKFEEGDYEQLVEVLLESKEI